MRVVHESDVTAAPPPGQAEGRMAGVWTLAGSELVVAAPDGPATLLVPTESVLLLAVDLPLSTRAKRIEALPFAVEDRIAEPLDSVHLALGAELAPRRYLVGVVRHEVMAEWVERAEAAGLAHAAIVPDALALPVPPEGAWSVDLDGNRAVVRAGDGTGFACPAALLRPAWDAAGQPPAIAYGAPLPAEMTLATAGLDPEPLARRLLAPALDLRQGSYARRRRAMPNVWRRVAWIVALGAAAHTLIALADTVMLQVIAERRAEEMRQLAAIAAPGINLGEDPATTVANLLPQGEGGAPQVFLPLATRLFGALQPLGSAISARALNFQGNALVLDLEPSPGLAPRLRAALAGGGVAANVTESPDGSIRVTATP